MTSERRKVVSVVFCDLVGSTALGDGVDPERLRSMLAAYFDRLRHVVEAFGGTVEKFVGDAVVAVFGVPRLHEDDALRALKAAVDMRAAVAALGLHCRIGVMTGEVVTGTEERLVTGDAVNVAARLEQVAGADEILVGAPTVEVVGRGVVAEPVDALALRGKSEPVAAYRLLHLTDQPAAASLGAPFVGRSAELSSVADAWRRVLTGRRCELVTIVGDPGIGKSRLVAEFLSVVDAHVVRVQCPAYGDALTYVPVVDALRQLPSTSLDPAAAAIVTALVEGAAVPTTPEEIGWAFRKALEAAAAVSPVIAVLDDVQWAAPAFLDLVEHVALLSVGAPILLLALSRPELRELRPTWPVAFGLGGLDIDDVERLLPPQVSAERREQLTVSAGGNPLFVEQLLATGHEGSNSIPATLHALLAARIDGLNPGERAVLELASVQGELFHLGAVRAMAEADLEVSTMLVALVRHELVRPAPAAVPGEDGFAFWHILIRDVTYDGIAKGGRALLHARFAQWLDSRAHEQPGIDELVGLHEEQACSYRRELAMDDDPRLLADAVDRLRRSAERAYQRADYSAAVRLFDRAIALLPGSAIDCRLEAQRCDALVWAGRGAEAIASASSLAERAAAVADRGAELVGRIELEFAKLFFESQPQLDAALALANDALPLFEAADDHVAAFAALQVIGWVAFSRGANDAASSAYDRAARHALAAGLPRDLLEWRAIFRLYGATPAEEILRWVDNVEATGRRHHWLSASRGVALAMLTNFEEARVILRRTRDSLSERGNGTELGTITAIESAEIELLAGDSAAAVELAAAGCHLLGELGETGFLSTAAAVHADALSRVQEWDAADAWAARSAELGGAEDIPTQMRWRQVRAKLLARAGLTHEAEQLAHEAIALGRGSDDVDATGHAWAALSEVLQAAGKVGEADAARQRALDHYRRKGNLAAAASLSVADAPI